MRNHTPIHVQLERARVRAGISKTALAEATGVPRSNMARVFSGKSITTETLHKLCDCLGLDIRLVKVGA